MSNITKEMFQPFLEIYPSEYKRSVYLNKFLYLMFDEKLIDLVNIESEVSGNIYQNLLENYHFNYYTFPMNSHTCRVIASFISYLGTNGGSQFFADVERIKQINTIPNAYSYELSWNYQNFRRFGHNNNYRAIDYLLNPVEVHPGPTESYFKPGYYEPNIQDYEIIDYVCKWLGSRSGTAYLSLCSTEISLRRGIDDVCARMGR